MGSKAEARMMKMLWTLIVILLFLELAVDGARDLTTPAATTNNNKGHDEVVVKNSRKTSGDDDDDARATAAHPQNFIGGLGGSLPLPTPGGTAAPGLGYGLPGVSLPDPTQPGGLGSSTVCTIPGVGCITVQPTLPGGGVGP